MPEEAADSSRDTLVYKDGDRVHGVLIQQAAGVIVFKSDRFGELRVPSGDAVVIKSVQSVETEGKKKQALAEVQKKTPEAGQAEREEKEEKEEQEQLWSWFRFSPAVLTAKVREFFGPWRGRVSFSDELVTDTSHRNSVALEGKLSRTYTNDQIDLSARYNYDQTNGVRTTDMFRTVNSWHHDFTRRQFGVYRPTIEWNRANRKEQFPEEYVLLQQELGYGYKLVNRPTRKIRLGISENMFDLWSSMNGYTHTSHAVESLFDEIELSLPWRITLTQRGVWYPVTKDRDGWENQLELNKRLTETLTVALRHEIRRNNPDGASQDYTRLKLLLGLDF